MCEIRMYKKLKATQCWRTNSNIRGPETEEACEIFLKICITVFEGYLHWTFRAHSLH